MPAQPYSLKSAALRSGADLHALHANSRGKRRKVLLSSDSKIYSGQECALKYDHEL